MRVQSPAEQPLLSQERLIQASETLTALLPIVDMMSPCYMCPLPAVPPSALCNDYLPERGMTAVTTGLRQAFSIVTPYDNVRQFIPVVMEGQKLSFTQENGPWLAPQISAPAFGSCCLHVYSFQELADKYIASVLHSMKGENESVELSSVSQMVRGSFDSICSELRQNLVYAAPPLVDDTRLPPSIRALQVQLASIVVTCPPGVGLLELALSLCHQLFLPFCETDIISFKERTSPGARAGPLLSVIHQVVSCTQMAMDGWDKLCDLSAGPLSEHFEEHSFYGTDISHFVDAQEVLRPVLGGTRDCSDNDAAQLFPRALSFVFLNVLHSRLLDHCHRHHKQHCAEDTLPQCLTTDVCGCSAMGIQCPVEESLPPQSASDTQCVTQEECTQTECACASSCIPLRLCDFLLRLFGLCFTKSDALSQFISLFAAIAFPGHSVTVSRRAPTQALSPLVPSLGQAGSICGPIDELLTAFLTGTDFWFSEDHQGDNKTPSLTQPVLLVQGMLLGPIGFAAARVLAQSDYLFPSGRPAQVGNQFIRDHLTIRPLYGRRLFVSQHVFRHVAALQLIAERMNGDTYGLQSYAPDFNNGQWNMPGEQQLPDTVSQISSYT